MIKEDEMEELLRECLTALKPLDRAFHGLERVRDLDRDALVSGWLNADGPGASGGIGCINEDDINRAHKLSQRIRATLTTPRLSPSREMVEALSAVAAAMLRGGDGAEGDFGWDITALNRARPLIRAALTSTGSNSLSLGVEEIRTQASAALDKFGKHRQGCNIARALPFERRQGGLVCTCGFDEAIRALSGQSGEALEHQHGSGSFQERVQPWMMECFGAEISADMTERCDRFIEEAFELVQSLGYDPCRITSLQSYVYNRPAGEPSQEVGGVMVTLAALCLAAKLDMHGAGETELTRIWSKVPQIRAKQAAKPVGSALPMHVPPLSPSPSGDATGGGEVTG